VSTEEVDDLLEWYLEAAVDESVDKFECEKKHRKLDKDVETAIKEASSRVKMQLQLWLFGAVLALVAAGLTSYTCTTAEIGAYRERIDTTVRQLVEMKQDNLRQSDELKVEIRQLREILMKEAKP
jgi:hypothetical protein